MQPSQLIETIASPFRQFIRKESASGILLILCTIIALIWANSPLADSYFGLWETPVSIAIGDSSFSKPLLLWVNDGLMAIFFFTIGLEIKKEVLDGELSTLRKASLPFIAAIGGMVVPVGLFFLLHHGNEGMAGWGIPMATDIAFSIGILSLLGSRVPLGMKVFLTAFAIVDDIGAVLIIALFYSHEVHWNALAVSGSLFGFLLICNHFFGIRRNWVYIIGGLGVWYYMFKSGIHPTIAGVLVALAVPATNNIRLNRFISRVKDFLDDFRLEKAKEGGPFLPEQELDTIQTLKVNVKDAQPPLQRLEYQLNDFIAYFVMPLFALANAGVMLKGGLSLATEPLLIHIAVALAVGKMLGIFSFSWLGVRLGLADLPVSTRWIQMLGLSLLGGIGFTMALFISNLALDDSALLAQAKVGILLGSLVAGLAGYLILWRSLRNDDIIDEEDTVMEKASGETVGK